MNSFSQELESIHRQISIRDQDRYPYTQMFDTIKNWLMQRMCDEDPLFKEMYFGTNLFGSYANRVRIIKPSEFDIFILLDFPFWFRIHPHPDRPGFIHITGEEWQNLDDSYFTDTLSDLFSGRSRRLTYLNRNKFQNWISDIIESVLSEHSLPYPYKLLKYRLCDVAHKMKFEDGRYPYKRISIDFVPAIILRREDVKSLVKIRDEMNFKDEYLDSFVAIPKRLIGRGPKPSRRYTFQLVNPVAERDIIWDHQNLKMVYRLLKSLRNNYNLPRLKSYFLTALFLHEVDDNDDDFWYQPVGRIFLHMLSTLIDYFDCGELPFYWAPGFNLLSILRPEEIDKYYRILVNAYNRLHKIASDIPVSYDVACHFETRPEEED